MLSLTARPESSEKAPELQCRGFLEGVEEKRRGSTLAGSPGCVAASPARPRRTSAYFLPGSCPSDKCPAAVSRPGLPFRWRPSPCYNPRSLLCAPSTRSKPVFLSPGLPVRPRRPRPPVLGGCFQTPPRPCCRGASSSQSLNSRVAPEYKDCGTIDSF